MTPRKEPMAFTDDDLKRFREQEISRSPHLASDKENLIKALLARLEAAERFIEKEVKAYPHIQRGNIYIAWLKASGR